jgi:protein-S-isoprenylcysteine O-methyltransferase Ste14
MEHNGAVTEDSWSRLGRAICLQEGFDFQAHKTTLLATAVKAFFLPLMYGWTLMAMEQILQLGVLPASGTWVIWLFSFGLCIDLTIATAGYMFSSAWLGTETQSVDDTITGWLVCLVCYPPLLQYLKYLTAQSDSFIWSDWLNPAQPLYWGWAALIVLTWLVYWFSTVAFGLRFSNLSYRGLVDIGPYRYVRHPAYLSKNIYWWLHTAPFYGVIGTADFARNVAGLSLISFAYYLRARTEERHLSRYPEYREYSGAISARWAALRHAIAFPRHRTGRAT